MFEINLTDCKIIKAHLFPNVIFHEAASELVQIHDLISFLQH